MEWISVEDRLPEYNKHVLATDGKLMWVAARWIAKGYKDCPDKEYFNSTICTCCDPEYNCKATHWMPLPKLPGEQ